uniref:Uncharacterized protein n=1 Tax=Entomoneis paludosa TaxID=265537 RepID=A0A7S2YTJ5_9STRA|mmetsp:Transcript_9249/g.19212  ORF Transcript_9249/g.19212 Transcript_9249/m.19212 type:complete len:226 (+) Transcript_9249:3-680(+)
MNKMGSTSLNVFMKCSKQFNTTHYGCGPLTLAENSKKERYTRATVPCGKCIHEALQDRVKKHAPLAACGGVSDSNPTGFNSFMQLDYNRGEDECIFPQMTALEEIHREYPHATLILLSRPLNDWINSVNHWQDLRQRFIDCNYEDLPTGKGRNPFQLQSWVCNHIARVRQFVKDHPTHALIELNLYDTKQADYYLSRLLLGASQGTKCFGKANQGDKQEEKKKSK